MCKKKFCLIDKGDMELCSVYYPSVHIYATLYPLYITIHKFRFFFYILNNFFFQTFVQNIKKDGEEKMLNISFSLYEKI